MTRWAAARDAGRLFLRFGQTSGLNALAERLGRGCIQLNRSVREWNKSR
jgi:hypothetical protein